jgi:hypothetical protein
MKGKSELQKVREREREGEGKSKREREGGRLRVSSMSKIVSLLTDVKLEGRE